jgi:predicted PurR-regulated permease PerM
MNSTQISARTIRQLFILILIVLTGLVIFRELMPYFSGILGAITFYILMRGWMTKLVDKGWNPNLSASLICLVSFVGILLPISGIILMLGNKIGSAVQNSERVVGAFKTELSVLEEKTGYNIASKIDVGAVSGWISENLQNIAGSTFTIFIAIGIMYFLLFYMLTDRKMMRNTLVNLAPVSKESLNLIGKDVQGMVHSNALGMPLVAITQGIIALIGFLIFGIEDPFFWFVIVAVGSMIPFAGTLVGILPVFIVEFSTGNTGTAWGILIYGLVVVGSADNIIRIFVLQKLDNIHPLITLIGVIVGVPLFGFIGLIFGPLLISLFLLMLSIYKKEYAEKTTVS